MSDPLPISQVKFAFTYMLMFWEVPLPASGGFGGLLLCFIASFQTSATVFVCPTSAAASSSLPIPAPCNHNDIEIRQGFVFPLFQDVVAQWFVFFPEFAEEFYCLFFLLLSWPLQLSIVLRKQVLHKRGCYWHIPSCGSLATMHNSWPSSVSLTCQRMGFVLESRISSLRKLTTINRIFCSRNLMSRECSPLWVCYRPPLPSPSGQRLNHHKVSKPSRDTWQSRVAWQTTFLQTFGLNISLCLCLSLSLLRQNSETSTSQKHVCTESKDQIIW